VYDGKTGVTPADAELAAAPTPPADAVTVNVYEVPLDNPVTVIGLDEPDAVIPPGELVTV
jgi:hypothetical protein